MISLYSDNYQIIKKGNYVKLFMLAKMGLPASAAMGIFLQHC